MLSRFLGRLRAIEQTSTFAVQVTQMIGLKSVCENTKQEMPGQMRGWSPPKHGVPAASKLHNVEITQARNLDVECLPVRYYRTDPDAWHGTQTDRRLDWREVDLPLSPLAIW
jgi:hypothetical protein